MPVERPGGEGGRWRVAVGEGVVEEEVEERAVVEVVVRRVVGEEVLVGEDVVGCEEGSGVEEGGGGGGGGGAVDVGDGSGGGEEDGGWLIEDGGGVELDGCLVGSLVGLVGLDGEEGRWGADDVGVACGGRELCVVDIAAVVEPGLLVVGVSGGRTSMARSAAINVGCYFGDERWGQRRDRRVGVWCAAP